MAYNLLKMHRKALMRLGMDDILQYLQVFLFYLIIFIKKHLSHYSLQSSTLQMNFQKKIVINLDKEHAKGTKRVSPPPPPPEN